MDVISPLRRPLAACAGFHSRLHSQRENEIKVFFCGCPPSLGIILSPKYDVLGGKLNYINVLLVGESFIIQSTFVSGHFNVSDSCVTNDINIVFITLRCHSACIVFRFVAHANGALVSPVSQNVRPEPHACF